LGAIDHFQPSGSIQNLCSRRVHLQYESATNITVTPGAAYLLKEGKGIAMRKRKGSVSEEVVQAPKEQEVPPYQSWQPSRLKTGIKNLPVGKKIFVR